MRSLYAENVCILKAHFASLAAAQFVLRVKRACAQLSTHMLAYVYFAPVATSHFPFSSLADKELLFEFTFLAHYKIKLRRLRSYCCVSCCCCWHECESKVKFDVTN